MDQRGIGRWDMLDLQSTQEAVLAMDVHEAGDQGLGGRPPSHDDGTPNETLANQVTRLRQLISLLETSLSGDDILLVFPDGTGPALLSALFAGIPLSRVHEIQFQPGEVRFNVNFETVRAAWPATPSDEYAAALSRGEQQLEGLRKRAKQQTISQASAESTRLAKKEAALTEWQNARQADVQSKRANVEQQRGKGEQVDATSTTALGAAAAGFVAWAATPAAPRLVEQIDDEEDADLHSSEVDLPLTMAKFAQNATIMPVSAASEPVQEMTDRNSASSSPLPWTVTKEYRMSELEAKIEAAPIHIPEMPTKDERMKAMDEYIESIDGGSAWLDVLAEMINEED